MNSAINWQTTNPTNKFARGDSYCQKKKNIYNMACVSSRFKQDQVLYYV